MGYMISVRVSLAAVVVAWSALGPGIRVATMDQVVLASALYVLLSVATEWVRRHSGRRALGAVSVLLLIDAVYLAGAMYATGGTQSPLRFLAFLHVVAVTLLASFKTGLKIALWYTLLTFVLLYAQAAELIDPVDVAAQGLAEGQARFPTQSVLNVTAFWLFALGTALLSALNERELRRARLDLHSLVEFGTKLEDSADPSEQARQLLDTLSETFQFGRGVVLRTSNGRMSVLAHRGPVEHPMTGAPVDPVLRQAQRAKGPLLLSDLDARRAPALASLLPSARNVMVSPLLAEGRFLGAVVVETGRVWMWIERRVVSMVAQFCSVAALHLRNTTLLKQVQELADTDALTGVANRRVFDSVLAREVIRASRQGTPIALALLDIDHFKALNDTYGHLAGDAVLRTVAGELNRGCRAPDLVAR
jgi:GAF domain-containing protein